MSMKKLWFVVAALLLSVRLHAAALPYDETADAKRDVAHALAAARSANKPALIVFGANWCPDCRNLDKDIYAKSGPLGEDRYVIVKVDVGNFDKNLDLAKTYGNPIKKGIPAAAVLTPDHRLQYAGPLTHLLNPYRRWLKPVLAAIAATIFLLGAGAVLLRRQAGKK